MPADPDPPESDSAATVACDEALAEPAELDEVVPAELPEALLPDEASCPEPPVAPGPPADMEGGLGPPEQAIDVSVAAPMMTRKKNAGPSVGSDRPPVMPIASHWQGVKPSARAMRPSTRHVGGRVYTSGLPFRGYWPAGA